VRSCRGRYAELAERAEVSQSWLSKFGRGAYTAPRVDTAWRLIAALDEIEGANRAA
jgi:predicted transcriptional regulator